MGCNLTKEAQDYAINNFKYDPLTGIVTRKITNRKYKAGSVVGSINNKGYLVSNFSGSPKLLHRVIWFLMTGEPLCNSLQIDHINNNKQDNRWENLRIATPHNNGCNRGKQTNNTSGFKGVYYNKRDGNWQCKLTSKGKVIHVGYFLNKEEAAIAYNIAAQNAHKEFFKGNFVGNNVNEN